ncbi:MAG: DUF2490 domain-containing protein [Kiritimatiellia bacterium]
MRPGALRTLIVPPALLVLACFAGPIRADDTQYWNEFVLAFDLADRVSLEAAAEQQFVDDLSTFGVINFTLQPAWELTDGFSLGPGFQYERELEEGAWLEEKRAWLHATVSASFAEWTVKLRTNLEYRDLEADDTWRLREKVKVRRPLRLGAVELEPFAFEEPFYDFGAGRWNQNRAAAGFTFKLAEGIEMSPAYMNLARRSGDDWSFAHVICTEVAFEF